MIMNALFELIGTSAFVKESEVTNITNTEEYTVTFDKPIRFGLYKDTVKVFFHHKPTSNMAKDFINNVAFAKVQYGDGYYDDPIIAELHSTRTEADEIKFLETLDSINYDNGYGGQELFGNIVFKDGTWLERGEYDGSEWWRLCKCPTEHEIFN